MVAQVARTKYGAAAIAYALGHGKGHNGKEKRNEYISTINMMSGRDYAIEMGRYWMRASEQHDNQLIKVIQSFSKNELDPENPEHVLLANQIGYQFAKKYYPNHQAIVFTQTDGKGGCVHNHIFISDVNIYTLKALEHHQYYLPNVRDWSNAVASQYFDLDFGKGATKDRVTQTERAKREKGEYVYKDDIKERVRMSAEAAVDMADFENKLRENGLDFKKKNSEKYGEHYTFELVDMSNVPAGAKLPNRALKARSYKMGAEYSPEAIKNFIETKHPVSAPSYSVNPEPAVEMEVAESEEPKTPKNNFATYCETIGDDWISFDDKGNTKFDWEKHAELQESWEEYKRQETVTSIADVPETPEIGFKQVSSVKKAGRRDTKSNEKQEKYQQMQTALQENLKKESNAIIAVVMQRAMEMEQEQTEEDEFFWDKA